MITLKYNPKSPKPLQRLLTSLASLPCIRHKGPMFVRALTRSEKRYRRYADRCAQVNCKCGHQLHVCTTYEIVNDDGKIEGGLCGACWLTRTQARIDRDTARIKAADEKRMEDECRRKAAYAVWQQLDEDDLV